MKRFIRQILIVCMILTSLIFASCGSSSFTNTEASREPPEPKIYQFELLSCNIEKRPKTNNFGGIIDWKKYLLYVFLDEGKVTFRENRVSEDLSFMSGYEIDFDISDEPKIVQNVTKKTMTFYLTKKMYTKIFETYNE